MEYGAVSETLNGRMREGARARASCDYVTSKYELNFWIRAPPDD
jgi:hypothetical protein